MDLDEARRRYPLSSVLSEYSDAPIEAGRKIRCPFPWHNDSDPSFHIARDYRWRCYGCGLPEGGHYGDVFDFLGYIQYGQSYEPGRHLREILDAIGELRVKPSHWVQPDPDRKVRPAIDPALEERYADNLGDRELAYWRARGLSAATLFEFRVGFDGKRYTFPYTYRGVVTAIKKRRDDDRFPDLEPKYLMEKGSRVTAPYNIDRVILTGLPSPLLIVEDEKSVLAAYQYGLTAISCPANGFRAEWVPMLAHINNIIIIADWDDIGLASAYKLRGILRRARIVQAGGFFSDGRKALDLHDMHVALRHQDDNWIREWLAP